MYLIRFLILSMLLASSVAQGQIQKCGQTNTSCWSTAARPSSPGTGTSGYNTTLNVFEYWNGTAWTQVVSSTNMIIPTGGIAGPNASTATGNEDTLATINIPAGVMGANGRIEVLSLWNYTNSGNNKTPRGYFGGQNCMAAGSFTTSATAQLFFSVINLGNVAINTCGSANGSIGAVTGTATPSLAINTANATTVTLTGQAAGGDTLTLKGYAVKIFPSP